MRSIVLKQQKKRPSLSRSLVRSWVPRGFAVVHSSSPGTGLSQGCPTVGGENETLAPKAVIDWLNGRARGFATPDGDEEVTADWCTGKVGMIGTSYNGTLALAAATTGDEHGGPSLHLTMTLISTENTYAYTCLPRALPRPAHGARARLAEALAI